MHKPYTRHVLLSLLLCFALLYAGPVSPFSLYASIDEDYEDEDYSEDDESNEEEEDYVDEPSGSDNSVNDTIRKLQEELNEVNDRLEDVQAEQQKLEQQLSNTQSKKGEAESTRDNYGYQVSLTETEISTLEQSIALLEDKIEALEQSIVEKQAEIDYNYDLFKKRVRAKYMQDDGTELGLLLGTDSFSDFLTQTEYMSRIAEHDQQLMDTLTTERIAIEGQKAALEDDKVAVEESRAQMESKKQQLSQLYSAASLQVHSLAEAEASFNADLEKNIAMQKAMKEEIDNLYREIEFSKNPYVGGDMAWPLPGYTTISSYFGTRFGGSDYHTGTDITGSGCYGAAVVAANDGVVVVTRPGSTGYGNYIMIDHGVNDSGQSVTTLYAHLSAINVSVGQTVSRGETIGKCGSTGWSTGPHLHFEVRLDGQSVNSLPYIQ